MPPSRRLGGPGQHGHLPRALHRELPARHLRRAGLDPLTLADYMRRHPIDVLKIVPSHLRALLSTGRHAGPAPAAEADPGRRGQPACMGGADFQAAAPECRIFNHYGPTETTVGVMTSDVDPARSFAAEAALPLGPPHRQHAGVCPGPLAWAGASGHGR